MKREGKSRNAKKFPFTKSFEKREPLHTKKEMTKRKRKEKKNEK